LGVYPTTAYYHFAHGHMSDIREHSQVTVASGLRWESMGPPAYPAWGKAKSCLMKRELWETWENAK